MRKLLLLSACILYTNLIFGLTGNGTSALPYSGPLTQDFTFGPGDVYVGGLIETRSHTLTIQPGTTLRFSEGTGIDVNPGRLIADGDIGHLITFTAANNTWGHVYFSNAPSGSSFAYCIFEKGNAPDGGAIYASKSTLQITYCTFRNNVAANGGALYAININAANSSQITIANSTFNGNEAQNGGAIVVYDSDANISDCTFAYNRAVNMGAGTYIRGGAIFNHTRVNNPKIERCKIYSNTSEIATGGIHFDTGAGGIIQNCMIYYNTCSLSTGGGVSVGTSNNEEDGKVNILNCVIADNTPYNVAVRTSGGSVIKNSIIWSPDKKSVYFVNPPLPSNLVNCAVQSVYLSANEININTFPSSFKLNALNAEPDGPNFYDPATYDYRIKLISPCRDKGISTGDPLPPATDFSGNGRVGAYDIGAYEVQYMGWTGAVNTDWGTAGNWSSGGLPASGAQTVLIPAGLTNYPTGSAGQDFTIGISNEMAIEPGAQVTLDQLVNNGTLYLCSDQNAIASLIVNSYDNSGGGKENVQLYLTGGGSELTWPWHYISSPVSSLSTDVFTEGPIRSLDLAAYYEDYTGIDYNLRWRAWDGWDYSDGGYPETPVTFNTLQPGKGYNIYFYETEGVTKSFGGILNTTGETEDLSYTGTENSTQGWNLIGNPFSSGLNWNSCIRSISVDNAIYFTTNNTFATYVNNVGIPDGTTGFIPPMQGFFVKANAPVQTVEFPLIARVHDFHSRYKGEVEEIPLIRLKIEGLKATDETVIRFDNKAKNSFDSEFDAYKFSKTGTHVSLWTTIEPVSYAINSIPFPETSTEVPVGINISEQGTYKITVTQLQELRDYNVYLTDKTSGFTLNLKITPSMIFKASAGNTEDRFVIRVIKNSGNGEDPFVTQSKFRIFTSFDMVNIQTLSDDWDGKYGSASLIDMAGRTISQTDNTEFLKSSLLQIPAGGNKGVYLVKLQSGPLLYIGKIILR